MPMPPVRSTRSTRYLPPSTSPSWYVRPGAIGSACDDAAGAVLRSPSKETGSPTPDTTVAESCFKDGQSSTSFGGHSWSSHHAQRSPYGSAVRFGGGGPSAGTISRTGFGRGVARVGGGWALAAATAFGGATGAAGTAEGAGSNVVDGAGAGGAVMVGSGAGWTSVAPAFGSDSSDRTCASRDRKKPKPAAPPISARPAVTTNTLHNPPCGRVPRR